MGIELTRLDRTEVYRKRLIREAVKAYEKKYPAEAKECWKSVKEMRDTRANVYGSDKQLELRFALRLPPILFRTLKALCENPDLFHEEVELKWFMRTFPAYTVPKKI